MTLECTVTFNETWRRTMNANPELHWSELKHIAESPAHYAYNLALGRTATSGNRSMRGGSLVHALVLGGDVVVYEGERRGKAWKEFAEEHESQLIVTRAEFDPAAAAAKAIKAHPLVAPLLDGDRERAWKVNMYGRQCAGRIDISNKDTIDLKFLQSARPQKAMRQALFMGMHAQLEWYRDARRAMNEDPGRGILIVCGSKAPYPCTVLVLTERALQEGAKLNRLWLERLAACEAADEWPEYTQSHVELDVVEDAGIEFDDGEAA